MAERNQLPPGWYKAIDPKSKRDYYYKSDGTRQWHLPQNEENDEDNNDEQDQLKSPSFQNSKSSDLGNVEKKIIGLFLHFLLFPFTSVFHAGIWMCVQLVFILLEMISGFVSLWMGGIGFLRAYDQRLSDIRPSFVVLFLVSDSLIWLGENILHCLLMGTGGGQWILKNPPVTFDTSPLNIIPESSGKSVHRVLYFIRLVLFALFRAFQVVWTVIAFVKLSVEGLQPTTQYIAARQTERNDYPQLADRLQTAHTANLVRAVGISYVTLNLVSLGLWAVLLVVLVLLRRHGRVHARSNGSSTTNNNRSSSSSRGGGAEAALSQRLRN